MLSATSTQSPLAPVSSVFTMPSVSLPHVSMASSALGLADQLFMSVPSVGDTATTPSATEAGKSDIASEELIVLLRLFQHFWNLLLLPISVTNHCWRWWSCKICTNYTIWYNLCISYMIIIFVPFFLSPVLSLSVSPSVKIIHCLELSLCRLYYLFILSIDQDWFKIIKKKKYNCCIQGSFPFCQALRVLHVIFLHN